MIVFSDLVVNFDKNLEDSFLFTNETAEVRVQTEYKRRMCPSPPFKDTPCTGTSTHIPLPQFSTIIKLAVMKTGKCPYYGRHCVQVQVRNSILLLIRKKGGGS